MLLLRISTASAVRRAVSATVATGSSLSSWTSMSTSLPHHCPSIVNAARTLSSSASYSSSSSSSRRCFSSAADGALVVPDPPTSTHRHHPLPHATGSIIYTETDEAPALATYSLYPVIAKFSALSNVDIVPCDISVAGRVLAAFPEKLNENQRVPDNLSYLGNLAKTPQCSIVKLPNISAPLNQLTDCIAELRAKGYDVPLYPVEPQSDAERDVQKRYGAVMGSAVNPVLREGNSDRRVAPPVKAYAQKNPHTLGLWSRASREYCTCAP